MTKTKHTVDESALPEWVRNDPIIVEACRADAWLYRMARNANPNPSCLPWIMKDNLTRWALQRVTGVPARLLGRFR